VIILLAGVLSAQEVVEKIEVVGNNRISRTLLPII
jgi:hypothetical protein